MSVLVIGGNGFIGRHLVVRLLQDKEVSSVVSMDVAPPAETFTRSIEKYGNRFQFFRGNVSQLEDVLTAVRSFSVDKVANFAYLLVTGTEKMPRLAVNVNLLGMCNVFEVAGLLGIPRVIYPSTNGVYGDQSEYGDKEVTEDDPPHPLTTYGIMKQLNDRQAVNYSKRYGIRMIGLRPAFVFGHGRELPGAKERHSDIISLPAVGKPAFVPNEPSSLYTLAYIDDVVEVARELLLAPSPKYDMYNVAGPNTSLAEVADQVRQYIPDAKIEFGKVPYARNWPTKISMTRAKEEFGIGPMPLKDAVLRHINEARAEAGLKPIEP